MCVSVDYSITAWDSRDINESKTTECGKKRVIMKKRR